MRKFWKNGQSGDVYAVEILEPSKYVEGSSTPNNFVLAASGPMLLRAQNALKLETVYLDDDPLKTRWLTELSAAGHMHELEAPYPGDQL